MALITCTDLSFSYEGKTVASHINFTVNEGDYLCIVGENGSGKSTLMKGLLGLKQPDGGSIVFGDGLSANELGYLPQQTAIQKDFPASVYEVVLSGCMNQCGLRPRYSRQLKDLARLNIRRMGMDAYTHSCYGSLSGGQQQRVLLARALCATRRILLLDEPVNGLDPLVTAEMYETIRRINSEYHIAVIMVSHDVQSALAYASHILHLNNTPEFFGTAADYKKSQASRLFLGGDARD